MQGSPHCLDLGFGQFFIKNRHLFWRRKTYSENSKLFSIVFFLQFFTSFRWGGGPALSIHNGEPCTGALSPFFLVGPLIKYVCK